ncbi:MAG TPA: hypothetical protein ENG87_01360 [Candidatus Pacearchaeota archaeon]|nr:hypothetical protein BMS3Abin17_00971 [archaeon BMS3Abin17]HDK41998.1 hypothetical protein [Candidatus Pacearchaeota archaeon]HDZ60346.1 hypothetical protein [Candidatus Pacearchaeota archaeon]
MENCHIKCKTIISNLSTNADIKKVFNKNDSWGDKPGFYVEHIKGDYKSHFVVQVGDKILDPFLEEMGEIPIKEYLNQVYKNPEELRII